MTLANDIRRAWLAKKTAAEQVPPDNEIWYWAPEKVTLYNSTGVTEHTFSDGKGVLKFAGAVTSTGLWFFRVSSITAASLPDSVTATINSFNSCTSLKSIRLPATLATIGDAAFAYCSNLELDSLPDSITSIGASSFSSCAKLTATSLPSSLTSIGNRAFNWCTGLAISSIPSGLTTIPEGAFYANSNIGNMEFHAGVTSIGSLAFYGSFRNLNNVSLLFRGTPSSIDGNAFGNNGNKIKDIYVPWSEGEVANAPWGATNATIWYNHTA